jgi:hypothetical protein
VIIFSAPALTSLASSDRLALAWLKGMTSDAAMAMDFPV